MNDHGEIDPFPEASVPERPEEIAALPAPAASAPPTPDSEAPTLPMIPVEQLRLHMATEAPASSGASTSPPNDSTEAAANAPEEATSSPATASLPAQAEAAAPTPPVPTALAGDSPAPRDVRPPAAPLARPDLLDRREPLYRECRGYRLRLEPPDLARLRELPGSRGKSDDEIGEAFFDGQADRLAASIADDVPTPSEIRVVVDPYSRQAFLALENRIRGILSF